MNFNRLRLVFIESFRFGEPSINLIFQLLLLWYTIEMCLFNVCWQSLQCSERLLGWVVQRLENRVCAHKEGSTKTQKKNHLLYALCCHRYDSITHKVNVSFVHNQSQFTVFELSICGIILFNKSFLFLSFFPFYRIVFRFNWFSLKILKQNADTLFIHSLKTENQSL